MSNITLQRADAYFAAGNHIMANVWAGFTIPEADVDPNVYPPDGPAPVVQTLKEGAIAQARRLLARTIGRAINDAEEPYDEDDSVREEFAVYEQALWMLTNSAIVANGDGTAPREIATDPQSPDKARDTQRAMLSPEAIRWLTGGRPAGVVLISG